MTQAQIALVQQVMDEAAKSLVEAFRVYWPTEGDTGAHEANLSLHVAHAFLTRGFHVYGEGHGHGAADRRYDLLAYSPQASLFVATEFKQLWSKGKIREMHGDLDRVLEFIPVSRPGPFPEVPDQLTRIGVVAGFSEGDERLHQLSNSLGAGECDATSALVDSLVASGALVGSHKLCCFGRHPGRVDKEFHVIYAIVPILGTPRLGSHNAASVSPS